MNLFQDWNHNFGIKSKLILLAYRFGNMLYRKKKLITPFPFFVYLCLYTLWDTRSSSELPGGRQQLPTVSLADDTWVLRKSSNLMSIMLSPSGDASLHMFNCGNCNVSMLYTKPTGCWVRMCSLASQFLPICHWSCVLSVLSIGISYKNTSIHIL